MNKKILISLSVIAVVAVVAVVATVALFSDTETSNGNTFAAGTLDLKIDGGDVNVSRSYSNMVPMHSQPNFSYVLRNDGSLNGYLNLQNISVTSDENGCNEPEATAGDTTCENPGVSQGELAGILNYRLMLDNNCNGWKEAGDQIIYQGSASGMADHYTINKLLTPGSQVCVNSLVNWWTTPDDNKAQGDNMIVNFGFNLNQDAL